MEYIKIKKELALEYWCDLIEEGSYDPDCFYYAITNNYEDFPVDIFYKENNEFIDFNDSMMLDFIEKNERKEE